MAWSEARTNLRTVLGTLGFPLYRLQPQSVDQEGVIIVLTPPGRDSERRASSVRRTTYFQKVRVMAHIPSEGDADGDLVAEHVDDAVESVNALLGQHLQLGGTAVGVTAPTWDEMTTVEWPGGSGLLYASMECEIEIEVEDIEEFHP